MLAGPGMTRPGWRLKLELLAPHPAYGAATGGGGGGGGALAAVAAGAMAVPQEAQNFWPGPASVPHDGQCTG
jgi:hypothetical protein